MSTEGVRRWLTLAANLGVLAALLLLLVEVREVISLSEANAYRDKGMEIQRAMQELALSADLAEILAKARDGRIDALNENERIRLWAWEFGKLLRMQNQFNDYTMGYLDDASYQAMLATAADASPLWELLGVAPSDPRFSAAIQTLRDSRPAETVPVLEPEPVPETE